MRLRFLLPLLLFAVGCHGQAPVSPAPTATVSDAALTCPSGYTCGYIPSRATCTSATSCPTPSSSGPYTALVATASALSTPTYTDSAPPTGVYVAYVWQFVYLTGPNITTPVVGAPSVASTAVLISLYPGTPGTPSVVETAELAPPIRMPSDRSLPILAALDIPVPKMPSVKVAWHALRKPE